MHLAVLLGLNSCPRTHVTAYFKPPPFRQHLESKVNLARSGTLWLPVEIIGSSPEISCQQLTASGGQVARHEHQNCPSEGTYLVGPLSL
jgi:hypothetical protein